MSGGEVCLLRKTLTVEFTSGADSDSSETKLRLNGESAALISAKDETIRVLQEQLEAEREAHREARRIIAGLVQRIPELESPQEASTEKTSPEPPESPTEVTEQPGRVESRSRRSRGQQEGAERVSWWRRMFK